MPNNTSKYELLHQDIPEQMTTPEYKVSQEELLELLAIMQEAFVLYEIIYDSHGAAVDFRHRFVNQAFGQVFNKSHTDLIGHTVLELLPNIDSYWIDKFREVARTGVTARAVHYSKALDKYFSATIYKVGPSQIANVFHDVTELKQTESQLLQEHELLQQNHEEMTATYEELTATEEELRLQYEVLSRSNEQIMKQNILLSALQETAFNLLNKLDMDQLLDNIMTSAASLVDADDSYLALASADGAHLEFKAGIGGPPRVSVNSGLMGKVYSSGQAEAINNYQDWEERSPIAQADNLSALFVAPLRVNQKVLGVFGVAFYTPGRNFYPDQITLLERFAELASLALENSTLHASLQAELDERIKSEATLNEIFNAANDAIIVTDPDNGDILWANLRTVELFGYSEDELKTKGSVAISSPENLAAALNYMRKSVTDGPQIYLRDTVDKSGRRIVVEINSKRAIIRGQVRCLTLLRDITARKKIEEELAGAEAMNLAMLNAIPDSMTVFDQEGNILKFKMPAEFISVVNSADDAVGHNVLELMPPDIAQSYLSNIQRTIDTGATQYYEYSIMIDGMLRFRDARFRSLGPDKVLTMVRDITDVRLSEKQIEFLSIHDALTKVHNRTYFETEMNTLASRLGGGVAIIVCDVDGLKLINDTLGHRHGDDILRIVSSMLHSVFPDESAVVARIGGDEFAVIVRGPAKKHLEVAVEEIRALVTDYNRKNPHLPVSLSLGWAADYDGGKNVEEIFKQADNEMYRQKMHQSQSTRSAIVQTMMKALEERDYITEGHADRLQDLAEKLGRKLKLPRTRISDLRLFAQFHDIGKVGIPDNILNKPAKLDPEELAIMQRHCEIGFRIARASSDLEPIADWILKHQEWWDGNGYPLGISGNEIPLECRILALADAFDAMTSDRPYRTAMPPAAALAEIKRCAGTQFDPRLSQMFIEILS